MLPTRPKEGALPLRDRKLGLALALAGLAAILTATLTPRPQQAIASAETPFSCLVCGDRGMVDVLLNLLLFMPLGFGLRWSGMSLRKVVGLAFLLTATVEFLQFVAVPGRDSSLSDVLTNTLGGTFGALLVGALPSLIHPDVAQARRLAILATVASLLVLAGSAQALLPWAPDGPLIAESAKSRGSRPPFTGKVTFATLSGVSLGDGPVGSELELRRAMRTGRTDLKVTICTGPVAESWSSILVLRDPERPILGLSQAGTAFIFEPPTYAFRLKLRAIAIPLSDAIPPQPGNIVSVAARAARGRVTLSSESDDVRRSTMVPLSPGLGWTLVFPFDYAPGPEGRLLTVLWLGGLVLPLGFWWPRAGLGTAAAAGAMATFIGIGLGIIPLVAGFPVVHWSEWAAAAAGGAAGWALARRAAYLQVRCGSPSTSVSSSS